MRNVDSLHTDLDRIANSRCNLVASMGDKGFIEGVVVTIERICC